MTAQFAEVLHYEGDELALCTQPLGDYFSLAGIEAPFESPHTALWRGYVGTWEIVGGRLYLIKLSGSLRGGAEASLATLFPDYPDRVFAHWYTGTMRAPQGKQLKYVHQGYSSTYERDLMITVVKGVVTKTTVRNNGTAESGAASVDGYGVNAMTVFSRNNRERQEQ